MCVRHVYSNHIENFRNKINSCGKKNSDGIQLEICSCQNLHPLQFDIKCYF